jgi:hypothetical protein
VCYDGFVYFFFQKQGRWALLISGTRKLRDRGVTVRGMVCYFSLGNTGTIMQARVRWGG